MLSESRFIPEYIISMRYVPRAEYAGKIDFFHAVCYNRFRIKYSL